MHMLFISPTLYKNKNKMFMIILFAQENFGDVFSSMLTYFFLSAYTK